jgi:hypothetical protein
VFAACPNQDLYELLSTLFYVIPPVCYIYPLDLSRCIVCVDRKGFADLLAFSIAMRVYFYAKYEKKKGLMWLSLASLLISLYSMA